MTSIAADIPILVRLYIIQGINLRSQDIYGKSDVFIAIQYGKEILSDRANYIPNQSNPIFGKRFQVSGILPRNHKIKISLYDQDSWISDDLIGSTVIDLEDRFRSKYGAACALPFEYNPSGYNKWRNNLLPTEILNHICQEHHMEAPEYGDDCVAVAGVTFKDSNKITKNEDSKERLALEVLNNFDRLQGIGYKFVPEHVETRSLFRDDRPGIEQVICLTFAASTFSENLIKGKTTNVGGNLRYQAHNSRAN